MNLKKQIRHCIMHAMPLNGFHKERYQEVIMVILEALLYERGENKDSAIYYLNKNLEDTKNIAGRGAVLLSLYDIEKI